jgi:FkbM family methyltransferase
MTLRVKPALVAALSSNPELFGWLRRGYCFLGLGTRTDRDFLFALAKRQKHVFFLEVGANDGKSGDPLHYFIKKYRWRGVALEPVLENFERLRRTYKNDDGVIPCCAALADRDGTKTFHRVRPGPDVPDWCNELGSFSREVILSHESIFPAIEQHLVEGYVETLCFDTLVKRFGIDKIDVILIDTEGYDYEVLKQIDFQRFRPSLVIYEHLHLGEKTKSASKTLLENFGYDIHNSYDMNYVAVRRRFAGR